MSPTLKDYLVTLNQLAIGKRTKMEQAIAADRQADISGYIAPSRPLHILDLGNGRLRPQYYLLKASGQKVTGIDLVNGNRSGWVEHAYWLARYLYTRHIPRHNHSRQANTLVCGDASRLPFVSDYFDLVTSVAAFEHFLDVPEVISELKRVLRPGGIAWVTVHFFTSPSGGHNLSFTEIPLRTLPAGIEPWDHLRQKKLPFTVPLNQWRLPQYLEVFSNHFELLKHYTATREGDHWLTPEIEAELSEYSREELTSMAYVIIARKERILN